MADEISFEEFRVDLAEMAGVIGQVKGDAGAINAAMAEIKRQFTSVEAAWKSPSALTFAELSTWFQKCQDELSTVLGDMITRLDAAYNTYHDMEQAALNDVS
ncbi:WXG100 family type VII secretion target [Actinoplanes sp. L3-i22]|uniref:WXG100 family type VII secretion target n=1 Tax=Actinoplanes sp. L3-i22 TaxID=2836373 RepID=UPI001C7492B5|nr:WXG100 family type VII secretion target [Actinoplanes sp. L3-i22]BCY11907.1 hypothetical protein L3i22_069950 [Actinoplanes sp. L3-i22]